MIAILLLIVLLITVPVVIGFRKSRVQRRIDRQLDRRQDRQHLAAFVGFSAGIFASISTIIFLAAITVPCKSPEGSYFCAAKQGLVFISGSVGLISSAAAFLAGAFSRGNPRIALMVFGSITGLIYLLAAFSNFGA